MSWVNSVILLVILGLVLAPHPHHWILCLIPAVALAVTVTQIHLKQTLHSRRTVGHTA